MGIIKNAGRMHPSSSACYVSSSDRLQDLLIPFDHHRNKMFQSKGVSDDRYKRDSNYVLS